MPPALVFAGSQRLEDRPQILDRLLVAADHHAVALFQSPHAARGAHVDKLKSLGGNFLVVAHRVLVIRVTAVDKYVAGIQQRLQLGDGLVHRLALRHHDPDGLAAFQLLARSSSVEDAHIAGSSQPRHRFGAEVEAHHLVAAQPQPLRHVAAHLAQTNQSKLHVALPSNLIKELPGSPTRAAKRLRL